MSLQERLQLVLDEKGIRPAHLAKTCGVTRATVSDWMSGETKEISALPLLLASQELNVEPLWLLTGRGPKRPPDAALARAIESLPTDKKGHLSAVVDAFTKSLASEVWDGITERRIGSRSGGGKTKGG